MKILLPTIIILTASACTWVDLKKQGQNVVISTSEKIQSCSAVGNVTAKTRHTLFAGIKRSDTKIAMELATLARNEATKINANTIVANAQPVNGEQSFSAYRCPNQ